MPGHRYVEEISSAAILATKRSAGVIPEVNLREDVTCVPLPSTNKAAHYGFETQRRRHQKSKKIKRSRQLFHYFIKYWLITFLFNCLKIKEIFSFSEKNSTIQSIYGGVCQDVAEKEQLWEPHSNCKVLSRNKF